MQGFDFRSISTFKNRYNRAARLVEKVRQSSLANLLGLLDQKGRYKGENHRIIFSYTHNDVTHPIFFSLSPNVVMRAEERFSEMQSSQTNSFGSPASGFPESKHFEIVFSMFFARKPIFLDRKVSNFQILPKIDRKHSSVSRFPESSQRFAGPKDGAVAW